MNKQIVAKLFIVASMIGIIGVSCPANVYAHVTIQPAQVLTGEYQTFTTSVPNEKEIPAIGVRLVMPNGIQSVTPTVKQGWVVNVTKSNDKVTEITWSGGVIDKDLRDEFTFSAQAPAKAGDITWKAYQTYQDGSVVSWDQKPTDDHGHDSEDESKGPYSVTSVVDSEDEARDDRTDASPSIVTPVLSMAAFVISLIALIKVSKSKQ